MPRRDLVPIAEPLGIKVHKNLRAEDLRRRILAREAEQALGSADTVTQPQEQKPANPAFEQLTQTDARPADPPTVPPAKPGLGKGGKREGAGRKPGQTDSIARMQNLPQQPNPAINDFLKLAFDAWATALGDKRLALTEQEAKDLALPYTQILCYLGHGDAIPDWALMAITAIWVTWNTVKARVAIAREIAAARKNKKAETATPAAGPTVITIDKSIPPGAKGPGRMP